MYSYNGIHQMNGTIVTDVQKDEFQKHDDEWKKKVSDNICNTVPLKLLKKNTHKKTIHCWGMYAFMVEKEETDF